MKAMVLTLHVLITMSVYIKLGIKTGIKISGRLLWNKMRHKFQECTREKRLHNTIVRNSKDQRLADQVRQQVHFCIQDLQRNPWTVKYMLQETSAPTVIPHFISSSFLHCQKLSSWQAACKQLLNCTRDSSNYRQIKHYLFIGYRIPGGPLQRFRV